MSKLLHLVFEAKQKDNAGMKDNWFPRFEALGIDTEPEVLNLYKQQGWSQEFSNRVFAFIILAYDKDSGWVQVHKNRLDNKRAIMQKLGGDMSDKLTLHVVENSSMAANDFKAWFMSYQRDWRWDTIMANFDYHAEMMKYGGFRTLSELRETRMVQTENDGIQEEVITKQLTPKEIAEINQRKGQNLDEGLKRRREGEALLEEIKKEFASLDTILEKEGFKRITDAHDELSWESFISRVRSTS